MSETGILEQAATWHARQDAPDMDWAGFTAWLAAAPANREAFDDIALLDAEVAAHRTRLRAALAPASVLAEAPLLAANDEPARPRRRWPFAVGGGVAAVAAALVAIVVAYPSAPSTPATAFDQRIAAGTRERLVSVAGAQVTLAPGSTLALAANGGAEVALTGRASFAVAHDPARTLVVRVAGYEVTDVGTRFDVIGAADSVRVRVAEGAVAIRHDGSTDTVRLTAGEMATGLPDGSIRTARAAPAALVGWQSGPLVYDAMPLDLVVADVARFSGRTLVLDPSASQRPFSGVIARGDGASMIDALARLAGLEVDKQGDTIRLRDRPDR